MLAILGDIHGDFGMLHEAAVRAHERNAAALIQVGDFGYYNHKLDYLMRFEYPLPIYWIDGNHEDHRLFIVTETVVEVHKNCFYVPRGSVLTLDNKVIQFMGGAASIDKDYRVMRRWHWSDLEDIRQVDLDRSLAELNKVNNTVDMIISHTPPQSMIDKHFDADDKMMYGVSRDWYDPNAHIIETLWTRLDRPQLYCGHMHRRVVDDKCTILDIDQLVFVP